MNQGRRHSTVRPVQQGSASVDDITKDLAGNSDAGSPSPRLYFGHSAREWRGLGLSSVVVAAGALLLLGYANQDPFAMTRPGGTLDTLDAMRANGVYVNSIGGDPSREFGAPEYPAGSIVPERVWKQVEIDRHVISAESGAQPAKEPGYKQ